jgi:hypothetical protein
MKVQLWIVNQRATGVENFLLLRFDTRKRPIKTRQRNSSCGELLPIKYWWKKTEKA